jgi:hypothetical protein
MFMILKLKNKNNPPFFFLWAEEYWKARTFQVRASFFLQVVYIIPVAYR